MPDRNKTIRLYSWVILLLAFPISLQANSLFDLMVSEDEVLQISLSTDIKTLLANKNTENWQPGQIQFVDNQGNKQDWVIELRPRGNYRRRVCDFPPLKFKFPKKKMKELGLGKHNDFKLVSHCLGEETDDQLVFKEYLIYKMYEKLSPESFRVQLVKIYYIDADSLSKYDVRYGILLEDEDELAERFDREECKDCYGMQAHTFQDANRATLSLFQYMIGNHDWSFRLNRNIKILKSGDESEKVLAVPYDFDFSRLVNAPYALQKEVEFPAIDPPILDAAQRFLDRKEEIIDLVKDLKLLSQENRIYILDELKPFYKTLSKTLKEHRPDQG